MPKAADPNESTIENPPLVADEDPALVADEDPALVADEAPALAGGGDAGDEVEVTIGDAPAPGDDDDGKAPEWVRDLRKSNREKDRRIRQLEQEVASSKPAPDAIAVGVKPTLEGCNFDGARFETELEAWHERKRQADEQQAQARLAQQAQQEAWNSQLQAYETAKRGLKVRDFESAEDLVKDTLSLAQQGILISGAEKPELLVYALGKNPGKAR
ncbi:MAG: hypothetical protein KGR26_12310, partial [Cyanobacteria bacterium REEB65]|nr:hypothetical protein [Cyanobacteria bacterium REEB65]